MFTELYRSIGKVPVTFWLMLFVATALTAKFLPGIVGLKALSYISKLFPFA